MYESRVTCSPVRLRLTITVSYDMTAEWVREESVPLDRSSLKILAKFSHGRQTNACVRTQSSAPVFSLDTEM